ncbi:MAG: hypothetical protein NTW87_30330 [Planctomycetota bacterium]|nr:hypothetical protein [Planctomycetota bacterium]
MVLSVAAWRIAGGEPTALIETSFGAADTYAAIPATEKNERISGALPAGWHDNSSWAKVWVDYQRVDEEQRAFLRVRVVRNEEGNCQVSYALPTIEAESFYRLTLTARSRTATRVQFGIRQAGAPYSFLWDASEAFKGTWQDRAYEFRLDKRPERIGFWIVVSGTGELDLARLRLVQLTREQLIEDLKTQHAGSPKNLLRISRLPLGLQSGWSLSREDSDGDDVEIAADESMVGPSSAPALRISRKSSLLVPLAQAFGQDEGPARPVQLYSAPFAVPLAFDTHSASAYVRGEGKGKLAVVCDNRTLAQKPFELTATWQRVAVKFKPMLMARAHVLRIECTSKLWLDALQVERGGEPTEYASQAQCEVALACDSPARVQFDDEEAAVRYCVSGYAGGAVLRSKVANVYGEETSLPDAVLEAGFLNRGKLRYDVFPSRPHGPQRIEAWVENKKGERLSSCNELVIYRLRKPRYWQKDAPHSPFGTHTLSTTRHLLMAKAVGINWVRLHDAGTEYIGWYHLERRPGEWSFQDREIARYRQHNVKILGLLSTAPEWASKLEQKHNAYYDRYYEPKRMEDFANYVKAVSKHYKGSIDSYDVWNEPWLPQFWHAGYDPTAGAASHGYVSGEDAPGDFALLMQTAYKAAMSVDKELTVLGFNTTAGGEKWTRAILEKDGLKNCDVVCYHHYTSAFAGGPNDTIAQGWQQAIGPIAETGKLRKPVWMSEGSPTAGSMGNGFYKHTLPYTDTEDVVDTSDRLCRYVVSLLGQNVKKVFLYSMHGHSYLGPKSEWRVLVTDEGYLHPSAAAHAAMAWLLEDTRFAKSSVVAEGVTAYFFEHKDRAVAVLSPAPNHAPYAPPHGKEIEVTDLFGNPVKDGEPLGATLVYVTAKDMERLGKALPAIEGK